MNECTISQDSQQDFYMAKSKVPRPVLLCAHTKTWKNNIYQPVMFEARTCHTLTMICNYRFSCDISATIHKWLMVVQWLLEGYNTNVLIITIRQAGIPLKQKDYKLSHLPEMLCNWSGDISFALCKMHSHCSGITIHEIRDVPHPNTLQQKISILQTNKSTKWNTMSQNQSSKAITTDGPWRLNCLRIFPTKINLHKMWLF